MRKLYPACNVPVSRTELWLWGLLISGSAYWVNVIRTGWDPGVPVLLGMIQIIIGNGAFAAGAWILIGLLALKSAPGTAASPRAFAATIIACAPAVLPSEQTAMLSLLAVGGQRYRCESDQPSRTIALLLFALAGTILWTSGYLMPLHAAVGMFDAHLVRILLQLTGANATGYANLVVNDTSSNTLEILAPCASSFPLSGVCLAFVLVVAYLGQLPRRSHMGWLTASLLASAGLTELRLLWMASSGSAYQWIHDEGGSVLYSLATVLLATLFPLLAVRAGRGAHA